MRWYSLNSDSTTAYTVKIMELNTKFTWCSVLKYDDEFCHVQAVHNYPWSYDSHHLHTVLLEPLAPKATPVRAPLDSSFAKSSWGGRTICTNFNLPKGCTPYECHFAHMSNRKENGKACGQSHPSHFGKIIYFRESSPHAAFVPGRCK